MSSRVVNLLFFYGFTTALAVGHLVTLTVYLMNDVGQLFSQHQVSPVRSQPMFGNCTTFYLDIGSNIGVQVRKLFEPSCYPKVTVLPVFDQYFGQERHRNHNICAIGIEMIPSHTARLTALEKHYTKTCGYSVCCCKDIRWPDRLLD